MLAEYALIPGESLHVRDRGGENHRASLGHEWREFLHREVGTLGVNRKQLVVRRLGHAVERHETRDTCVHKQEVQHSESRLHAFGQLVDVGQ